MIGIQSLSYIHPNREPLFENLDFRVPSRQKVALIGNNGAGKSTLLRLIAGILEPSGGKIEAGDIPYYLPQVFGQFDTLNVAQALNIEAGLEALHQILSGNVSEGHLSVLNDDWDLEERSREAMQFWKIRHLDFQHPMALLSGGEKTKVLLAGVLIHQPSVLLLDEPSNHLDQTGRKLLYDFIRSYSGTLVVVSHDRSLLNQMDTVHELSRQGIRTYGGNYEFYVAQKQIELQALKQDLQNTEKTLRKARESARETIERQQKLDARGRKKQEKAGTPTIALNTLRNNAEKSTSRIRNVHGEKIDSISNNLNELRSALPEREKISLGFDDALLHKGKTLVTLRGVNHAYGADKLWRTSQDIQILSDERIALRGSNGTGKSTLLRIILGDLQPQFGEIKRAEFRAVYIDQDYSLIDDRLDVYSQAQVFNNSRLMEHEIKIRLDRFLFTKDFWDKPCHALSGGEKMRLMLCCISLDNQPPDMIVLDEPTNNLDIQNLEILTAAISKYHGTLIIVSHDDYFLEQVHVKRAIYLS